MNRNMISIVAAAGLATSACTTSLAVYRDKASDPPPILAGVPYRLPALHFDLSSTHVLTQCVDDQGEPDVLFAVKLKATPSYVAGETFVIDYNSLSSGSKISSVGLESFDNGTIKGFNAAIEDKTAEIVKDILGIGFDVARLAAGAQRMNIDSAPKGLVCSEQTVKHLADVRAMTAQLDQDRSQLQAVSAKILAFDRIAATVGLNDDQKSDYVKLIAAQAGLAGVTAKAAAGLEKLLDEVTVAETESWSPTAKHPSIELKPSERARKQLLALFKHDPVTKLPILEAGGLQLVDFEKRIALLAVFAPSSVPVADDRVTEHPQASEPKHNGLYFRIPEAGRLLGCRTHAVDACLKVSANLVLRSEPLLAPQFGRMRVLPLSNEPFQNNELKAAFRADGSLASFSYADKAARGKALSGAVADAVGQALAFRDSLEARDKTADEKAAADAKAKKDADLVALNDQIARLEAQKKLNSLLNQNADADALAPIQAETALINARLALEEARLKFELSRSKP